MIGGPAAETNGSEPSSDVEPDAEAEPTPEPAAANGDWDYVPMSEWADEIESNR